MVNSISIISRLLRSRFGSRHVNVVSVQRGSVDVDIYEFAIRII